MRSFTLILLLLVSSLASAANFRFTYVATPGNVQHNGPALNAQQEALLNNWLWANYAPTDTVEGSPTFGQVLPRNTANEAEAYKRWADATWKGTRAQIRKWKREQDQAVIVEPVLPAE